MESRDTRGITLAINIGGTFTDAVLEVGGQRHAAKVLTTSPDPDRGFLESAHHNKNHDVLVNALGYLVLTRKELS